MIMINNLNKEVKDGKNTLKVLDSINVCFPNSGLYCIYGKSGSGKTTLINILFNDVKKTSGFIKVADIDYDSMSKKESLQLKKSIISVASQDFRLFNDLTVKENIRMYLEASGITNYDYSKYLKMLEIEDIINLKASVLSGGEKQRVGILIALSKNTPILIMDEPTSSLDEFNSTIITKFLKEISEEKLVIVSTHDYEIFDNLADGYIRLEYGKVIENNIKCEDAKSVNPVNYRNDYSVLRTIGDSFRLFRQNILIKISIAIIITLISFCFIIFSYNYKYDLDEYNAYILDDIVCPINEKINYDYWKEKLGYDFEYIEAYEKPEFYIADIDDLNITVNARLANWLFLDESLTDDSIIISDYTIDTLNKDCNSYLSNTMSILGNKVKVIEEKTGYEKQIELDKNEDEYTKNMHLYYADYIKMNSNTLKKVLSSKMYLPYLQIDECSFHLADKNSDLTSKGNIIGKIPEDDNEIVVDGYFRYYYKNHIDSKFDVENDTLLGKEVSFDFFGNLMTFKIVGEYTNINSSIIQLYDGYYNQLIEEFGRLSDYKMLFVKKPYYERYKLFKETPREEERYEVYHTDDYSVTSFYTMDLIKNREKLSEDYYQLSQMFTFTFILVVIAFVFSFYIFNKRKIAILLSIGFSSLKIGSMALINIISTFVLSLSVAFASSYLYLIISNVKIKESFPMFKYDIYPICFNYQFVFISLICLSFTILGVFIIMLLANKNRKNFLFGY